MFNKVLRFFDEHNVIVRSLALILGSFVCAIVYNAFIIPNNIVYGGLGGLAIVVNNITGISPVTFLNISVGCTLLLSIFILGYKHTIHSIIGYGAFIIMVNITSGFSFIFNVEFDSFLFGCIFYGLIFGVGSGLIYRSGFDTGGIDTILVILRDKFKVPFATVGNIVNGLIIISGVLIFGYVQAIYAIITLLIINHVSESVLIGLSSKKMVFISSKYYHELVKFIEKDLDTGYTLIQSTNGIGLFKRTIIMCVVPTYRFFTLKAKVKELDDHAELYSHDCYNVTGGRTNQIVAF